MCAGTKDMKPSDARLAVIYGARAGTGGLGHSAAWAITALAHGGHELIALGPGYHEPWSLPGGVPKALWLQSPEAIPDWKRKYSWLRWRQGELTFKRDRALGEWAARQIQQRPPFACYSMTQVGLESLRWARQHEVFAVLDNPNGHISNFQQVCERESLRWCGSRFSGHPTQAMADRVAEEYEVSDCIRVYSEWSKRSMVDFGVPPHKIQVLQPSINLDRFRPPAENPSPNGPLRICYVGSLDLRKGFVYLLRAIRDLGARHIALEVVGATGDRHCAALFAREKQGLEVRCVPGDPLRAYQESEIFIFPTLEDGFGFVLPEAMACGLPAIITDQCGAGECVRSGEEGWIVAAGDVQALAAALETAIRCRKELPEMGRKARSTIEEYCGPRQLDCLAGWFSSLSDGELHATG